MRLLFITPLVATAAAAGWIAVAPMAAANTGAGQMSCSSAGTDSECQTPGNVQINDSPPVQFGAQYPFWEGDEFGGGYHGGGRGHR
jgi:hypothetical protein